MNDHSFPNTRRNSHCKSFWNCCVLRVIFNSPTVAKSKVADEADINSSIMNKFRKADQLRLIS